MGKVYLPHNALWVADLMSEMTNFPVGRHDDMVDALGLIGRMLDTMSSGKAPHVATETHDRWQRAFARRAQEQEASTWKGL